MADAEEIRRTILKIILNDIVHECFTTWDIIIILQRKYREAFLNILNRYGHGKYSFRNYVATQLLTLEKRGYIVRSNSICGKRRGFTKKPKGIEWSSPCIAEWCRRKRTILEYIST
ncbi:MAG: hypothetical protein B6U76_08385 [Desulfurococcales archaeon ex4484_217_2]|nr:MAG: hypothetical protein B6U76_08385 [Desulfurococcales archaeon ex4484_217_2]